RSMPTICRSDFVLNNAQLPPWSQTTEERQLGKRGEHMEEKRSEHRRQPTTRQNRAGCIGVEVLRWGIVVPNGSSAGHKAICRKADIAIGRQSYISSKSSHKFAHTHCCDFDR